MDIRHTPPPQPNRTFILCLISSVLLCSPSFKKGSHLGFLRAIRWSGAVGAGVAVPVWVGRQTIVLSHAEMASWPLVGAVGPWKQSAVDRVALVQVVLWQSTSPRTQVNSCRLSTWALFDTVTPEFPATLGRRVSRRLMKAKSRGRRHFSPRSAAFDAA